MVNVSLPNLPILVAEDDPVFRGLLGSVLESSGHPVEMVVDGQAALERVKQTPGGYALVITDIQMPRLNGLELARALQSTPDPVPMIAMTGFGDMDLVVQLLRLGVQDFLEKPFSFDDMTRRVAAVLRRRKERPSAPGPGELLHEGQTLRLDRDPEKVRRLLERLRDDLDSLSAQGDGLIALPGATPSLELQWKWRKVSNFGTTLACFQQSKDRISILVARPVTQDGSAVQMSVMVRILHEALWSQILDPQDLLETLGRILVQQKGSQPLLAQAIDFRPSENRLQVASAGFPPPIALGHGTTHPAWRTSPPLGTSPNMDVETITCDFPVGERILLLCPSFPQLTRIHPTGARMELGFTGAEEMAMEHRTKSLPELTEQLWQAALEYCNWHPRGDLFLLGLLRKET